MPTDQEKPVFGEAEKRNLREKIKDKQLKGNETLELNGNSAGPLNSKANSLDSSKSKANSTVPADSKANSTVLADSKSSSLSNSLHNSLANSTAHSSTVASSLNSPTTPTCNTSSPLQQWKLAQQAKIASRESASAERHREIIAQALHDIEAFYSEYKKNKEEAIAGNRRELLQQQQQQQQEKNASEACCDADAEDPAFWDRVKRIVEQVKRPKTAQKDISRMKELIWSRCSVNAETEGPNDHQ
jgi:hypothetical protein